MKTLTASAPEATSIVQEKSEMYFAIAGHQIMILSNFVFLNKEHSMVFIIYNNRKFIIFLYLTSSNVFTSSSLLDKISKIFFPVYLVNVLERINYS